MGYPMTYQRFVKRNNLSAGDYAHAGLHLPTAWAAGVNTANPGLGTEAQLREFAWPHVVSRIARYEQQLHNVLGDLRRLETDSMDEHAICIFIAHRLNIDPALVALVLKEFLNW